jgi:hypothetical protein
VGRIESYEKYKGGNLKERYLFVELDVDGRVMLKPSLNGSLCKGELESAGSSRSSLLSHEETVMNHWIPQTAGIFLATGTNFSSWRWSLGCRFTKYFESDWLRHVTSMSSNRIPKIILNYRSIG